MAEPENDHETVLGRWLNPQARGIIHIDERASLGTRPGSERKENEDRVVAARFGDERTSMADLFVVCDGMGGMVNGAECAEAGISTFVLAAARQLLTGKPANQALAEAAHQANRRVHALFGGRGGTTIAALLAHRGGVSACCVGDSRVYAIGADGTAHQMSRDDTVKGALNAIGQGGLETVPEHERLVQFIGMGEDLQPQVFPVNDLNKHRYILLSTDGIYRLPGEVIVNVARTAATPKQVVDRLLHIADWFSGSDDATALAVSSGHVRIQGHEELHRQLIRLWGPNQALLMWSRPYTPVVKREDNAVHEEYRGYKPKRDPKPPKRKSRKSKKRPQQSLPLDGDDSVVIEVRSATGEEPDGQSPGANGQEKDSNRGSLKKEGG